MKVRALFFAAAIFSVAALQAQTSGSIDVPDGVRALLVAKGEGVQIYTCSQAPEGQKWVLKGPDAKLLDANGKMIGTHSEGPTWTLNDGGELKGQRVAGKPSPDANSVDWLLLRAQPGTPKGSLSAVAFIRRTETRGGGAPNTGCQVAGDIGKRVEVPYTATYTFYVPQ